MKVTTTTKGQKLAKNEEIHEPEPNLKHRVVQKYEQIKAHVRKNQKTYYISTIFVVAGVTFLVTRRVYRPDYVFAKKVVIKDSMLFFGTFARDQGPPSYLVECVETGAKYLSQVACADAEGISASTLSQHLNGARDHIHGKHYVRLAMITPRNG